MPEKGIPYADLQRNRQLRHLTHERLRVTVRALVFDLGEAHHTIGALERKVEVLEERLDAQIDGANSHHTAKKLLDHLAQELPRVAALEEENAKLCEENARLKRERDIAMRGAKNATRLREELRRERKRSSSLSSKVYKQTAEIKRLRTIVDLTTKTRQQSC